MNPGSPLTLRTGSPAATEAAGRRLGAALEAGDVLALNGVLGAGKTCFVRGLLAGLGGAGDEIRSPTFVLHQVHLGGRCPFHHMDLYRLSAGADVSFLDLAELLIDGVVAVEWAERGDLLDFRCVDLRFRVENGDERVIELGADAPPRLAGVWQRGGAT